MMVSEMSKQDKSRLFSVISSEKIRVNKHKFKYRKQTCFCYKSGQKVAQVVQASCQVFIVGVIQNPSLPNSKQPGPADPALSRGLD